MDEATLAGLRASDCQLQMDLGHLKAARTAVVTAQEALAAASRQLASDLRAHYGR